MNKSFISKLETSRYLIGSFDSFIEKTKQLIKDNSGSIDELEKKISVLVSDIYPNNNVSLLKQHS